MYVTLFFPLQHTALSIFVRGEAGYESLCWTLSEWQVVSVVTIDRVEAYFLEDCHCEPG
jgi:hypothetical protein